MRSTVGIPAVYGGEDVKGCDMQETDNTVQDDPVATPFSSQTVIFNQAVCRLRMLVGKLENNFALIDTVYQKVLLGGMARQCSALVSQSANELEALQGLCWSNINDECEEGLALSYPEWEKIGNEPPAWLRHAFESAIILTAMPDEESMQRVASGSHILVLRAPNMRGDGLLPQVAALMPKEFDLTATQIWWPWVMGGQTPVVLEETDKSNVLQEVSAGSWRERAGV